jgi:hypothetical protein
MEVVAGASDGAFSVGVPSGEPSPPGVGGENLNVTEVSMAQEDKSKCVGTVFLTFLAGAVLGAGIALIVASRSEENENNGYEEADLFV